MSDDIAQWLANAMLLKRVAKLVSRKINRFVEPDEIYDILVDHWKSVQPYVWIHLASGDNDTRSNAERRVATTCVHVIQGQLRSQLGEPRLFLYRQMQLALADHEDFITQTSHTATWYARTGAEPSRRDDAAFERAFGGYATWASPREIVTPKALMNHWKSDFRKLAAFFADQVSERMGADLWIPLVALRDFVAENYDLALVCPSPLTVHVPLNDHIAHSSVISPYDRLIIDETLQKIERLRALHAFATNAAADQWLRDELRSVPYLIEEVLNRIEDTERGAS